MTQVSFTQFDCSPKLENFASRNLLPKQHQAAVIILLLYSFSWGKGLRPLPVSTSPCTS